MKQFNLNIKHITIVATAIFLIESLYYLLIQGCSITAPIILCVVIDIMLYILYKKSKNKTFLFLLIISFIASIYYYPYLLNQHIFCFDNDHYTQYQYFYKEWGRLLENFIKTRSFPFYSFNSFLGDDFFASKSFHVTGDVLFPILMVFPTINEGVAFQSYLTSIISAVFVLMFLKQFGIKNEKVLYCSSALYAIGIMSVYYSSPLAWKRFYSFMPLLFYAIERYRDKDKASVFTIAVALLLLSNYYNMFSVTIFLPIYFIFTYAYHMEKLDIKFILLKGLRLIIFYLLGFLLSGIVMIPTVYFMLNNPRVGSGISNKLFFNIKIYIGYLYSMITHYQFTLRDQLFVMNDNGHLSMYSSYINSILVPASFSFMFARRDNKKGFYLKIFIIITIVIFMIPPLNSIIHGFSGASLRPIYLVAFVYLIAFSIFFDSDKIDTKALKKGLLLFTCIFLFATIIGVVLNIIPINLDNLTLIFAVLALVLNYIYILIIEKKDIKYIFIIACVISIVMNIDYMRRADNEYEVFPDTLDRNAITYIKDMDEDKFYRININDNLLAPFTILNLNQSLNYEYKGTSAYDSTYEGNLRDFLYMNNIKDSHIIRITNPECLRMLGVKYYYVEDEKELPKGYTYEYITNNNHFKVYKMNEYRPIGFTYSSFTNDSNQIVDENSWNSKLLIDSDLTEEVKNISESPSVNFNLEEYYDDNNLKGTISNNQKQVLFLSIPYNKGWKVKDNGESIQTYKVQGGFIGIILEPGDHYIELSYTPKGFKAGVLATTIGFVAFVMVIVIEKRKTKNIKS